MLDSLRISLVIQRKGRTLLSSSLLLALQARGKKIKYVSIHDGHSDISSVPTSPYAKHIFLLSALLLNLVKIFILAIFLLPCSVILPTGDGQEAENT